MMSKQDYELVAVTLAQTLDRFPELVGPITVIGLQLARAFSEDNPRFDIDRFAHAVLTAPRADAS